MPLTAEASIDIEAPIDLTWEVMLDFGAYAAWNPFIFRIDGAAVNGADLRLHVRWRDGTTVTSRERVITLDPPAPSEGRRTAKLTYDFRGPLRALYMIRAARDQMLEQSAGGPTRYRTVEVFRGLLTDFLPFAKVQDGFERHARALKERAESLAAGGG